MIPEAQFSDAALCGSSSASRGVIIYWDRTPVEDPLAWTLEQFEKGKLPAMIERGVTRSRQLRPVRSQRAHLDDAPLKAPALPQPRWIWP